MHYYQFNIGDYKSHTEHLTPIEDIAFRRMLDYCYLHESPLPKSVEEIAKKIRMREHCTCIADVLQEFFVLHEDGYKCKRVEKEIKNYKSLSSKRKKAANKRWANNGKGLTEDASALQMDCTSNTKQEPRTINQEPLNNGNKNTLVDTDVSPHEGKISDCPHSEIINAYHQILPECDKVIISLWKPNTKRYRWLQARWRESEKHQSIEFWRRFFQAIRRYPFYIGQNDRAWKVNLEWMVKSENFIKLVEKFSNGSKS